MTSKSLFFNLIKEDLKRRLWVPALVFIIFFFTFPVRTALTLSDYTEESVAFLVGSGVGADIWANEAVKLNFLARFQDLMSFQNDFVVVLVILFSVICAVSGFTYLHSKVKTDFFHSVPVSREKLFAGFFTGGVLFMMVPYAINLVAASVIAQLKLGGLMPWGTVVQAFFINMAFFMLIYATVLLAVILTGNLIVSLLGTGVFFTWMPILSVLIYSYHQAYFSTFYSEGFKLNDILMKLSPVTYYTYSISAGTDIWQKAGLALIFAAAVMALTLFLYRIRPSEAAGKAMAFRKSCPIIKFILVVPLSLTGSLIFKGMRDTGLWSVFGLICGLLLSYGIIEIIYNFDFKKMFSHKWQFLTCGCAAAAILGFFTFDIAGYDTYLPSKEKVETVSMYSFYLDNNTERKYYRKPFIRHIGSNSGRYMYLDFEYGTSLDVMENMKLKSTDELLFIAQKGIEAVQAEKRHEAEISPYGWEENYKRNIVVGYNLKGGRTVYRNYQVDITQTEAEMASVYSQKEYKEAVYPLLKTKSAEIAGINYQELDDYRHVELPDAAMVDKLLGAYQEELAALTYQTRKEESPIGALQFKTHEMQEMIDTLRSNKGDYLSFNDIQYYPIYPSFTKTIALLKLCGIEAGDYLNEENVDKIELLVNSRSKDYISDQTMAYDSETAALDNPRSLIVKDKAEIAKLLKALIYQGYSNELNPVQRDIEVTVYVQRNQNDKTESDMTRDKYSNENAEYDVYRMNLDKDQVPEFVKKGLNTGF